MSGSIVHSLTEYYRANPPSFNCFFKVFIGSSEDLFMQEGSSLLCDEFTSFEEFQIWYQEKRGKRLHSAFCYTKEAYDYSRWQPARLGSFLKDEG